MAVPLGHPVYTALEQMQMRGLIDILPYVKPYSRAQVISIINGILDNEKTFRFGALSETERVILGQYLNDLSVNRQGLDLTRGTLSTEHTWNNFYFSAQFGFGMETIFAGSYFSMAGGYTDPNGLPGNDEVDDLLQYFHDNKIKGGFEGAVHPAAGDSFFSYQVIPSMSFTGDLGKHLSYGLTLSIWAGRTPRTIMGTYMNITEQRFHDDGTPRDLPARIMPSYSEPLSYFPYTYKKRWDGYVWPTGDLSTGGMLTWPQGDLSLGYSMMPEFSGSVLGGHILFRFARLDREWAGMSTNSSLVLNQSAQPFLAFETTITPFTWVSFSSLTGVLEYHNMALINSKAGIQNVAETFQNAFSIVMLEFNIKNIMYFNFGSSAVWPKRFELGYIFPFADNFIYQTNIGDFDNMALFFNTQLQYPGIGRLWASLYFDEMSISSEFSKLARMMFAYQVGGSFNVPWLPFSSITLSYTKVEPFTYGHLREIMPWYGDKLMETNYVSFGNSLGHYIPPNSDEFLIKFEMIPAPRSVLGLQYQLIRHGASYGERAVGGASLSSELLTGVRDKIYKYFLRDGAYQWNHILKLSGEYSLSGFKMPVKVFGEFGFVYSYFTDCYDESGELIPINGIGDRTTGTYKIVRDDPRYPNSLNFVAVIGIKLFPKF